MEITLKEVSAHLVYETNDDGIRGELVGIYEKESSAKAAAKRNEDVVSELIHLDKNGNLYRVTLIGRFSYLTLDQIDAILKKLEPFEREILGIGEFAPQPKYIQNNNTEQNEK